VIVTRSSFETVVEGLLKCPKLSVDTETTGLRPFHGDRLFSVIVSDGQTGYYFNFQPYPGLDPEQVLLPLHLEGLKKLFARTDVLWYLHNAKYDRHILANEGIFLPDNVTHCALALARVEYNEHFDYSLAAQAKRIGLEKSEAVEEYIDAHPKDCKTPATVKGRKADKHFDRVPFDIIAPYGETDGIITYRVGDSQEKALQALADETPALVPKVTAILRNERRLTDTIFRMERVGLKIDRPYCTRAAAYEQDRAEKATQAFKRDTGRDFKASGKLFAEVFASEKDRWVWGEPTKTGQINPSFESDVLKNFQNPAAKAVLEYRDAKSKSDFYLGFLYHADRDDIVHPHYNPHGAAHGRFSSSDPNFQNLTSEEDEEELKQEFVVRRAIIPRPGFLFITPDYDQMEYRMMFDLACQLVGYETPVVTEIKKGKDPHQATADLVTAGGTPLTRKRAKNGNFAFLYGSGVQTLADTIGAPVSEARALREALIKATPEVKFLVDRVARTARTRGFIFNWAGRRCYLTDPNFGYKMPNYLISGGCADVNKFALNRIDERLLGMKSRLICTIHDENPVEVHESEVESVPKMVKESMESVYPYKYLPLTCGMEWSATSLGDKKKGFPV
jgi:DNA polymerase-1